MLVFYSHSIIGHRPTPVKGVYSHCHGLQGLPSEGC